MSLRSVLVAAAVVAAALAPGAAAEPSDQLIFKATGSAWTEFELPRREQLRSVQPRLVGGKQYAGVVLEHIGAARDSASRYAAFRFAPLLSEPRNFSGTSVLPAGRYRVVVLADAPVTVVFVLANSGGGKTVRADRRVTTLIGTARATAVDGPGSATARVRTAVPADFGAFLLSRVDGTHVDQSRLCATRAAQCPSPLLPQPPPSPLPAGPPSASGTPSVADGAVMIGLVAPESQARDAVASIDGLHRGTTTLTVASLAYLLR